jgi:hypothetical protein
MCFVTTEPEMVAVAAGSLWDIDSAEWAREEPVHAKTTPRHAPVVSADALPGDADVPTAPSAPPLRRAHSGRIVRREILRSPALDPMQRSALIDRLYAIQCETLCGESRDEFEAGIFGEGEVCFALFYGAHDELAGFSHAAIERIEHAGRRHAVFCAGVFFRQSYHGGLSALLFAIHQSLRFKLREPRTPLAYLTRSTTPVAYRLLAKAAPRIYPSRTHQTPDEVDALVREVSARRQYGQHSGNPWVVREHYGPSDPSRMRSLENDPYVRFYTELNPRFAKGEALLTWIPLDLANVAGGLFRVLRARLAR